MLRNILLVALGGAIGSVWFFVAKLRLTGKDTKWTCHCDTSTSLYCVVFELAIRVGRSVDEREHRNIILRTPTTKFMKIACSHRFLERSPCSHRVRKKKNQQLQNLCKLLIFSSGPARA